MSVDFSSVPPTGRTGVRSLRGLGAAVVVLLGLVIAADVFAVVVGARMYALRGAEPVGFEVHERWESLYRWSDVATMNTYVACGVVFILWFRRARINAEVFAPDGHRLVRGWAVWGWLVPVVNLWIPRRVALDIWSASTPGAHLGPAPRQSSGLVNAWWAVWIGGYVPTLAALTYAKAEGPAETRQSIALTLLSVLLDIAAAVLAVRVVRRLTAMQHRKALEATPVP
ncbi:DUF4328 domain-containing protein [Streptomyces sp. NPDC049887]|uniref:DUF4328 domain-containing protein n=1 Tax=Streptomyces sp. NPDC049887 TaxID=3155654 RepID=UPI003419780C